MKKIFILFFLTIITTITISCGQVITNKFRLDKAFTLYEKGKNEDDDKALLDVTKTYNDIINQKIYAQDRQAAVYRALGERSLAKSQYAYSAKYFTEALKILPNSPYLRYGLGLSYANLSESADTDEQKKNFIERAEKNIEFAISKDEKNPNYYAALASLRAFQQQRYDEALELILKSVEISPNNTDYLFILAKIQYSMGNDQKAIETYRIIANSAKTEAIKRAALQNADRIIKGQYIK